MDAVDRERNRLRHIAGPKKVGVHRVHDAVGTDGVLRGDERLRKHLPAEDAAERHPLAWAGENAFARMCSGIGQVECRKEPGEGVAHAL